MIPTIYKGDDTDFRGAARLSLRIGTEADLSGCTVEFTFLGQTRRFSGDAAAKPLSFAFSASETALFPVGVHRARVRVFDPEGRVKTVDDSVRIRVTDSVADAYGTDGEQPIPVSLVSGFTMPDIPESLDAAASDTVGVFKAKFNDLLALLRSVSALAVAVLLPFAASAANVETAPLDDIPGTAAVVTNVTLAGLATTNAVASAIASATNDPTIVRGEKLPFGDNLWNIGVFSALTADQANTAGTANNASYVPWSGVLYTPTTLVGYGVAEDATNVVYGIVTQVVAASNPTFSNAVLAVGLNIDTNFVAVLNEIASTFGGFPIEGTATTVGGLLAALAAAVAWLRKNKADKATTLAGYGITDAETKGVAIPKYEFVTAAIADGVLTVASYTNAQIMSDGTAFTVAVAEGDGKARDCQFTLDCTSLEISPTITWGTNFHPRTDAETDFACVAGVRNVYWITEYASGEFAVAGWQVTEGGTSGGAA